VRGLLAAVTHAEMGLSFSAAYDALGELEPEELQEWEQEWRQATHESGAAQKLAFGNRNVSVIDMVSVSGVAHAVEGASAAHVNDASRGVVGDREECADGGAPVRLRSLHFNDRLDVVQSCVALDSSGAPILNRPPPLRGPTATYTQGLALAVAYHSIRHHQENISESVDGTSTRAPYAPRITILGAGACVLPAFLHEAVPTATVDAVEVSLSWRVETTPVLLIIQRRGCQAFPLGLVAWSGVSTRQESKSETTRG